MREIRFRGYATEKMIGNQWLYGFGVMNIDYVDGTKEYLLYTIQGAYEVLPESIGQFTGLTDKNGREIYEGDIVKLTVPDRHYTMQGNGYSDIMREDGFEFVGEVKFLHAMWFIKESLDGYPLIFDTNQTLEVIGNIYQHSHLLKENEK